MSAPAPVPATAAVASSSSAALSSSSSSSSNLTVTPSQLHDVLLAGQQHASTSDKQATDEIKQNIELTCKWKTNSYDLALPHTASVGFLKHQLALLTNVRPHNQKLILKTKITNQKLTDDLLVASFELKPKTKFSMIGNPDEDLIKDDEAKGNDMVDDLDYDYRPSELLELQKDPAVLKKLQTNFETLKQQLCLINPIRSGKKLLVLDLDYTLFDMKGDQDPSNWRVLRRPHTHRFLTALYEHYELVIWSQTSWRWLELKLTELGILTHPSYKITFVLDKTCMFRVESPGSDGALRKHHVKPLELIWRMFPNNFSAANTIHLDDLGRNFALNPQSGLKILPYKNSAQTRATDKELIYLKRYLAEIAKLNDFRSLDHSNWRKFLEKLAPTA